MKIEEKYQQINLNTTKVKNICLRYISPFLLLFVQANILFSQLFPVTATVNVTGPALTPYLHQWSQPLTLNSPFQINIQFNDLNNDPLNAVVRMHLDGPGVTITSSPNLPTIVTLQPGQIISLDANALASLFSVDRLGPTINGIGQVPLPEGIYTFCVEVFELLRNTRISNTACTVIKVQSFDVPEWRPLEPVLQLPDDEVNLGVISLDQNALFTLNWSPRHPQIFVAEYELELFAHPKSWVQMTSEQVVNSTFPFFRTTTFSTSYLYQPSDPPLDTNHIYLARITVRDPMGDYQFANNGFGPVGTFAVVARNDNAGGSLCADPANRPVLTLELAGETGIELSWQLPDLISDVEILVQSLYGNDRLGWQDYGSYPGADGGAGIFGAEAQADRYRVGFLCPDGTMMWSNVVSTLSFPEVFPDSCGIPVDLHLENTDPLEIELLNGDSILVGDFVMVLEDAYYNGLGYSGIGYIATPLFNIVRPRIAVELINVQVNTDFRMMGGMVNTIYDEDNNLLVNIGDLQALFAEIGGIDDLAYSLEEFSDSIVEVRINTNGETEIITLDSLGNLVVHTLPFTLNPPEGISTILIRDGYVTVGDVFLESKVSGPTTFVGADGKIYGQVDEAIYSGTDLLNSQLEDSLGALGLVYFEKHPDEPGGLDPHFPESNEGDYGQIEEYIMPWKALLLGTSERVLVDVSQSTADSFYLVTHSGYQLSHRRSGDQLEVDVPAINDGDLDALYVLGRTSSDPALHTLGGMRMASYPLKLLSVNVIPINGAEIPLDEAALATALNQIYNPAIATWQVKILDNQNIIFDEDGDGILATGKGTTSQFNQEMRNVTESLGGLIQKGTKDSPILTIVVVPQLDAEYDGYMPRGRNLGFVRSNAPGFARVIAHELGHGAFGLQHSWEEYPGLAQGASDNLMDYGSGARLTKRQWDQIHTPLAVLGLFETIESGGSVGIFMDLTSDLDISFLSSETAYVTPSGAIIKFKLPPDKIDLSTCKTKDFAQGTLCNFTFQGKKYVSVYLPKAEPKTFYGYYASDYLETIKSDDKYLAKPENEGLFSDEYYQVLSSATVKVVKTRDCKLIEYEYSRSSGITELRGALISEIEIPYSLASSNYLKEDIDCPFCDEQEDFIYEENLINYESFKPYAFFEFSQPIPEGDRPSIFQKIVKEQADDLMSKFQNYEQHPYDEFTFYHIINPENLNINISGTRLLEIEHKLAFLKESIGVNIIVNIQRIEYNLPKSLWNELATEVALRAGINTSATVLINIPFVDLIKYLHRDTKQSYLMPGIWESGGLLTSDFYQQTFPLIENLYDLIIEVYKNIDKPYVVFGGFLFADKETVQIYRLTDEIRKRGESSIHSIQLYEDGNSEEIIRLLRLCSTCLESADLIACTDLYSKSQTALIEAMEKPNWKTRDVKPNIKEKYIQDNYQQIITYYLENNGGKYSQLLEQYYHRTIPADAFYSFELIEYLYDINDGLGIAASFVGLDPIFDASGVILSVFDDDPVRGGMNAAFNSASVMMPLTSGGMIKAGVGGVTTVLLLNGKLLKRVEIKTADELIQFYKIDLPLAERIFAKSEQLDHLWKSDAVFQAISLRPKLETTKILEDILDYPSLGEIIKFKPYLARSWLKVTDEKFIKDQVAEFTEDNLGKFLDDIERGGNEFFDFIKTDGGVNVWLAFIDAPAWARLKPDILELAIKESNDEIRKRLGGFYTTTMKNQTPAGFDAGEKIYGGVWYNKYGFPNFEHLNQTIGKQYNFPGAKGNYTTDFSNARDWLNKQPGIEAIDDYNGTGSPLNVKVGGSWKKVTWHHHENGTHLIPVFTEVHIGLSHTGGVKTVELGINHLFDYL